MSPRWELAQINVGRTVCEFDDPQIAEFFARLDEINALADTSPGFVWRLQSESGNATDILVSDDPRFIINMSAWETIEALFAFAYRTEHQKVMRKRRQWFERPTGAHQALWWIPAGHRPTADEGLARLADLERAGPGPGAFTFSHSCPPPDAPGPPTDLRPEPYCVS